MIKILEWIFSLLKPHKPSGYPIYSISWTALRTLLQEHGITCMLKEGCVPDEKIFFTDLASWKGIIPFLVIPAEHYIFEAADCDDYGRKASADSAILFGLNGCLECWGNMPDGYHAFNLILGKKLMLFEPNAGFPWTGTLFNIGENGYSPEWWKV